MVEAAGGSKIRYAKAIRSMFVFIGSVGRYTVSEVVRKRLYFRMFLKFSSGVGSYLFIATG